MAERLSEIRTPALILDLAVLLRNADGMSSRMKHLGVKLRPHMKTAKSADVAKVVTDGETGAVTVSTLKEAEYFIENGTRDLTYAVGIVPEKLREIAKLQRGGAMVRVLTDDLGVAELLHAEAGRLGTKFSVLIDIDTGYHRSGVAPDSALLLQLAKAIHKPPHVTLAGVLTHAGHSYQAEGEMELRRIAEAERAGAVDAAERLRDAGFPCAMVSVGSTPTCVMAEQLEGVTEVRPGNYMFFDLFMAGKGLCTPERIAVSVLTSVIVSRPELNHAVVDAGGLALSKDLSAHEGSMPGVGYGLVRDMTNERAVEGLIVKSVSQEHGWLGTRDGKTLPISKLGVGQRFRILPNHSCMTAAAYDRYYVVDTETDPEKVVGVWPRVNGW